MFNARVVAVVLVSLFACSCLAQTQAKPGSLAMTNQFIHREKDFVAAVQRHASAVVDEELAEEFHEIAGDGRLYSRSEVLNSLAEVELANYSLEDFKVLPVTKSVVIVTYVANVSGTYKGQPLPARSLCSSTWVRRTGSWRMMFHQSTQIPPGN